MHSVLFLQCSIKVGLCSIASIIEREIVLYMFVFFSACRVCMCVCVCVFLCLSVCIIWMLGSKSTQFVIIVYHHQSRYLSIVLEAYARLNPFTVSSGSATCTLILVQFMINNTIDYLVLLAITFLLVIDFIYSFAVCF